MVNLPRSAQDFKHPQNLPPSAKDLYLVAFLIVGVANYAMDSTKNVSIQWLFFVAINDANENCERLYVWMDNDAINCT